MAVILSHLQGLADSKFSGTAQSVAAMVGLDIHSVPGLVSAQQKMTKESGTTVSEFVKVAIAASNGYSFWFSSTTGKIWARSSSGTWTLAYTSNPSSGSAANLGAWEYNGYIYWATAAYLHRIAIANADDSWAGGTDNFAAFGVGNTSWHPMAVQNLTLFIGDGNYVASVDINGTFTANALDIKTPLQIKCMDIYGFDLVMGTFTATTVNKTELVRWDTVSPSWNVSKPIKEVGINAFLWADDDLLLVQAGRAGNWYYFTGTTLKPYKKIPGTWSNTQYGTVNPGAVGNYMGRPIFGFSNGTGNPAPQGIYTIASYSKDYQKALTLDWLNSQDLSTGQEIGAILVLDFDILMAWKDNTGSAYGVDKIDYTTKYASAYFETRMLFPQIREELKVMQEIRAYYNSLPAGCGVTMSYSKNGGAYVAMTGFVDSKLAAVKAILSDDEIGTLQIKFALTVSTNSSPALDAFGVEMDETQ